MNRRMKPLKKKSLEPKLRRQREQREGIRIPAEKKPKKRPVKYLVVTGIRDEDAYEDMYDVYKFTTKKELKDWFKSEGSKSGYIPSNYEVFEIAKTIRMDVKVTRKVSVKLEEL